MATLVEVCCLVFFMVVGSKFQRHNETTTLQPHGGNVTFLLQNLLSVTFKNIRNENCRGNEMLKMHLRFVLIPLKEARKLPRAKSGTNARHPFQLRPMHSKTCR